MVDQTLKPCPFCGDDKAYVEKFDHHGQIVATIFSVVCRSCACEGGWGKCESAAIRHWNMRVKEAEKSTTDQDGRLTIEEVQCPKKHRCGWVTIPDRLHH